MIAQGHLTSAAGNGQAAGQHDERVGATPVSIAGGDPAEQILDATGGTGADRGIEAVGYQAHDPDGGKVDRRADGYTKVLPHPSA